MSIVSRVRIYGLPDSVMASKYPMAVDVGKCTTELTPTVEKLSKCEIGSGHDQFLTGIIVQFDLNFTIKAWTEAERYHFLDFVSSQSTMHRVVQLDARKQCIKYVTENTLAEVERLKDAFIADPSAENYLALLYNVPVGFRLTARMTTNYRQLKTIYSQRKSHRLPEWREFCKWAETLPYSELITGVEHGED